jgi:hypothetical protein
MATLTADQIDDLVDRWHAGEGEGQSLRKFLGMNRHEYAAWVLRGTLPGSMILSRNAREGYFMGRAWGKAVRRYAPFVPFPQAAFARAFRRGQLVRRSGVPIEVAHLADQQGAS